MNSYKLTVYFKADDEMIKDVTVLKIGAVLHEVLGQNTLFEVSLEKNNTKGA